MSETTKAKLKEIGSWAYGLTGMVAFFAFLFYGGNFIIRLIALYYIHTFLALILVAVVIGLYSVFKK